MYSNIDRSSRKRLHYGFHSLTIGDLLAMNVFYQGVSSDNHNGSFSSRSIRVRRGTRLMSSCVNFDPLSLIGCILGYSLCLRSLPFFFFFVDCFPTLCGSDGVRKKPSATDLLKNEDYVTTIVSAVTSSVERILRASRKLALSHSTL